MVFLGAFLDGLEPNGGPLGCQMAELGCQDTDWVGGNKKEITARWLDTTDRRCNIEKLLNPSITHP